MVKIKKHVIISMIILLIAISCLSCVSAEDSNINGTNEAAPLASGSEDVSNDKAYLILDNDADKENIYIGDYVTWTVSVINKGPDTAKNVKVYDQLPDGLKYIKHSTTKGTFNPETGIWTIGNLTVNDNEVFLYITTKAVSVGEKINKANLTSDTFNLNEKESYEEEEIDVFDYEVENSNLNQKIKTVTPTGNPIFLILIALFVIFIPKRKYLFN